MAHGLFVGLITLDCIYQVDHVPSSDEKTVAEDCLLVAGGPATNAAVAFRYLGNSAQIVGGLGQHPVTSLIRTDLAAQGVEIYDLLPGQTASPSLSTILVTAGTGDRAVVSRNAVNSQADPEQLSADLLDGVEGVLIDGHQMAVGTQIARLARQRQIPVILDAGSWKPGFENLLPLATSVIASARFLPPGCQSLKDTLDYLEQLGIPEIAITRGTKPILYSLGSQRASLPVPTVTAKDTLGAGDIFHGAFCHYRLQGSTFQAALILASVIAARSCQSFGTRAWMNDPWSPPEPASH
ncbi:MAG: sugar kinase [Cyanobacteria bacterium Co-bin13]|nr:sugar kinase [Cyanobacteria bacterium Co-bin13]